jgi:hypothetical protein
MSDELKTVAFTRAFTHNGDRFYITDDGNEGEYVPASVARDLLAKLAAEKAVTEKLVNDIHGLAVDLRDAQALVAKLIAAWPDLDNDGPLVCRFGTPSHPMIELQTIDGFAWDRCKSGSYLTKEAAILAAIGEGGAS